MRKLYQEEADLNQVKDLGEGIQAVNQDSLLIEWGVQIDEKDRKEVHDTDATILHLKDINAKDNASVIDTNEAEVIHRKAAVVDIDVIVAETDMKEEEHLIQVKSKEDTKVVSEMYLETQLTNEVITE